MDAVIGELATTEKLWIDGDGRTWRKKTVPVLRVEKSRDEASFGHSRVG